MSNVGGISATANPTHSIFFLAPAGLFFNRRLRTSDPDPERLRLLPAIRRGSIAAIFLCGRSGYQPRYRFRLMELEEPSEDNSVYSYSTVTPYSAASYHSSGWITDAFKTNPSSAHVLAENIVALIILPQLAQNAIQQAPTRPLPPPPWPRTTRMIRPRSARRRPPTRRMPDRVDSSAQLPPVVQVTMVAIDEASAVRVQGQFQSSAPNFGISSGNLFQNSAQYTSDLDQLEANLQQTTFSDPVSGASYSPAVTLRRTSRTASSPRSSASRERSGAPIKPN